MKWVELIFTIYIIAAGVILHFLAIIHYWKVLKVSKLLAYLKEHFRHRHLKKKAIKEEIEPAVNDVVKEIQKELPPGWIKKVAIKWVKEGVKLEDMKENETFFYMPPVKDEGENFVRGIFYFFSSAIFPQNQKIIPDVIKSATALQLSRRLIKDKRKNMERYFDQTVLDPEIDAQSEICDYLHDFDEIDEKGFFRSVFLRVVTETASRGKLQPIRNKMQEEIEEVLKHIIKFTDNIATRENLYKDWHHKNDVISYAFLLVAHPTSTETRGYVKAVRGHLRNDIETIYVMGAEKERNFFYKVINAIKSELKECNLTELFELRKDYRGQKKGVGAVFVRNKNITGMPAEDVDRFFGKGEKAEESEKDEKTEKDPATKTLN